MISNKFDHNRIAKGIHGRTKQVQDIGKNLLSAAINVGGNALLPGLGSVASSITDNLMASNTHSFANGGAMPSMIEMEGGETMLNETGSRDVVGPSHAQGGVPYYPTPDDKYVFSDRLGYDKDNKPSLTPDKNKTFAKLAAKLGNDTVGKSTKEQLIRDNEKMRLKQEKIDELKTLTKQLNKTIKQYELGGAIENNPIYTENTNNANNPLFYKNGGYIKKYAAGGIPPLQFNYPSRQEENVPTDNNLRFDSTLPKLTNFSLDDNLPPSLSGNKSLAKSYPHDPINFASSLSPIPSKPPKKGSPFKSTVNNSLDLELNDPTGLGVVTKLIGVGTNIGRGLFGQVEEQPFRENMESQRVNNRLNNMRMDNTSLQNRIALSRRAGLENARISRSEQVAQAMASQVNAQAASTAMTTELQRQQGQNQIDASVAQILNQRGEYDRQTMLTVDDLNTKNRAAKDNLLSTGLSQLSELGTGLMGIGAKRKEELFNTLNLNAQFPNFEAATPTQVIKAAKKGEVDINSMLRYYNLHEETMTASEQRDLEKIIKKARKKESTDG